MKIRMKIDIPLLFHNIDGVKRGDIVEVDDANAARYCSLGYAEGALKGEIGPAFQPAPLAPITW